MQRPRIGADVWKNINGTDRSKRSKLFRIQLKAHCFPR